MKKIPLVGCALILCLIFGSVALAWDSLGNPDGSFPLDKKGELEIQKILRDHNIKCHVLSGYAILIHNFSEDMIVRVEVAMDSTNKFRAYKLLFEGGRTLRILKRVE